MSWSLEDIGGQLHPIFNGAAVLLQVGFYGVEFLAPIHPGFELRIFSFSKIGYLTEAKEPSIKLLFIHSSEENRLIHAFLKGISMNVKCK